jgi:hypothetical protein
MNQNKKSFFFSFFIHQKHLVFIIIKKVKNFEIEIDILKF